MSVYRPKGSPYYHFDFQWRGHRFHGSTKATAKREAETVEREQRERALMRWNKDKLTVHLRRLD
jgi:hypothetical protein